ncbi:hypothetical protein C8P66_12813 [Humitalea rosea]|uniref:AlgX/AlgJ SGNH hydrolase-like domain-containing protein n=1 Tax=Humitalea rosea TaxID=990373 RepID=A0A2W7HY84_9PROT|nr:hypothetical protein [Humitalea rosea]PZW39434.1 hypothetical protein C8P66_12813 [Humitalea rosea]
MDLSHLRVENDVLFGLEGELYLAGGNHGVLRFATGETVIRPDSIANMRDNLEFRRDAAARMGFSFVHMIAPEKYRVVSEQFPLRDTGGLAQQYAEGGCEGMIDPIAELRAETAGPTYYRTDTHWAPFGKIVASRLLALASGRSAADVAEAEAAARACLIPAPEEFCGDLGRKLDPKQSEPTVTFRLAHRIQTFENGLPHDYVRPVNDGRMVLVESAAPLARGTLLIFGDSYLHQTLPVLSFFFRRVIFCRTRWFHEELVAMARPDVVVTQQAERYLSYVFPDVGAPPFLLMAQMLGRTPAPSQEEALALANALSGGRTLDLRPFARIIAPVASKPIPWPNPGPRVALLGNRGLAASTRVSSAAGSGPVQKYHSGKGFATWADMLLDGALEFEAEDNFGDETGLAQDLLGKVPALLARQCYWACIYSASLIDPASGDSPLSVEDTETAMRQTWDALRDAGLHLFIVEDWTPPGQTAAEVLAARSDRFRLFATAYAAEHQRVHLVDTGERTAPQSSEDAAVVPWNAWRIGERLADAIRPNLPQAALLTDERDFYAPESNIYGNIIPNGLMKGDPTEVANPPWQGNIPPGWTCIFGGTLQAGSMRLETAASVDGIGMATWVLADSVRSDRTHAIAGIRVRLRPPAGLAGRLIQGRVSVLVQAATGGLRGVDARLVCSPGDASPLSVAHAFDPPEVGFWPVGTVQRLVLRTPRLLAPSATLGSVEMMLVAVFDGTQANGCRFRLGFERASIRLAE